MNRTRGSDPHGLPDDAAESLRRRWQLEHSVLDAVKTVALERKVPRGIETRFGGPRSGRPPALPSPARPTQTVPSDVSTVGHFEAPPTTATVYAAKQQHHAAAQVMRDAPDGLVKFGGLHLSVISCHYLSASSRTNPAIRSASALVKSFGRLTSVTTRPGRIGTDER